MVVDLYFLIRLVIIVVFTLELQDWDILKFKQFKFCESNLVRFTLHLVIDRFFKLLKEEDLPFPFLLRVRSRRVPVVFVVNSRFVRVRNAN